MPGDGPLKKMRKVEPEIPITPMLDMAFQLLTFFVLTYRPAPTEGQFSMNLLPAQPATKMEAQASVDTTPSDVPAALKTLPTILRASDNGGLGQITLGENNVADLGSLKKELEAIVNDPTLPFDQALIKVDRRLRYAELMKVINVFNSLEPKPLTKISFGELEPGDEIGATP